MIENWNVVGHAWAVNMLRPQAAQDSPRHAYLFAGPQGIGRRTLALRFAQALNCTQPIQPGLPCGVCRDCAQIKAIQHPDLVVIEAVSEGGNLKVDQVREVFHSLAFKPYQSKYRVAIFLRFQEATEGASNALLKTLEEAPAYAVLILTADSPEALLPTIVSRCEVLRLSTVPLQEVEAYLRGQGAENGLARLLAHVSGGRPGLALRLLSDPSALAFRDQKLGELLSLLPASRARRFAYAEKLAKDKVRMRSVMVVWLSFWRDVLCRASGASVPLANVDREQAIESLAQRVDLSSAREIVSKLDKGLDRLEANVNSRLLAEVLLLDWPR